MTTGERLERIESGWLEIQALVKTVLEMESRTQGSLKGLNESITRPVDAADVRMKRIEENLDALIRAAEHTNAKGNR